MSRGNSIIAGVVLIGVLGTLSIALQATTPTVQMVAVSNIPVIDTATQVAATAATDASKSGQPAKMGCFEGFEYTAKTVNGDIKTSCKLKGACVAQWGEAPFTAEDYKKAGGAECIPEVEQSQKAGAALSTPPPPCKKRPANQCDLKVCVGDKCAGVTPSGKDENLSPKDELLKKLVDDVAKGDVDAKAAEATLKDLQKQGSGMSDAINNAFKDQIAEQEKVVKESESELNDFEKLCPGCSAEQKADAEKTLAENRQRLASMRDMQSRLAAAQTSLNPGQNTPCTGAGCSGGGSGGGGDTGSGQGGQRPPSTFPGMGQGGGGQQGGGGGQQNQNNNPYQQCYPQYFCVNSTLYWGNTRQNASSYYGMNNAYGNNNCQTQVVQRCQYGCSGNACAQSPQNQTSQTPVATLSCGADKPYDVGMDVPLRFTCKNSETSKGSGFATNNSMNGSTTAEIKKPPPGADVVSYGLTCVAEGGRTDSARCDVKINVPSIVLVANPKEVERNASTTIGWITQGMESCTISSPNAIAGSALEEFNDDNKDNTNVSGVAVTPGLEDETTFELSCATKGNGTKKAAIKVKVQ